MVILQQNFFTSSFSEILSFVANVIEIATVIVLGFLAIRNKNSSLIWFRIAKFFGYLFRIVLVLIFLTFFLKISYAFVFPLLILLFKGSWQGQSWEYGQEGYYILSYICYGIIIFPVVYLPASVLFTFSVIPAKRFLNVLLPNIWNFKIERLPDIVIRYATYGSDERYYDVTDIIRKMAGGNSLTIRASNELNGDPHPNVPKKLLIDYDFKGHQMRAVIKEGHTETLPKKL